MESSAHVLVEASDMVLQDLFRHIEEVEYLAEDDWSDAHIALVRELIPELTRVVRQVLGAHRVNGAGLCRSCETIWPCQVVITVHSLIKVQTTGS